MPRDIPVGNGQMLVCFDQDYQIRDIYFPNVGQENHAGGGPCRFGVHTDVPLIGAKAELPNDACVPGQCRSVNGACSACSVDHSAGHRGLFWTTDGFQKQLKYVRDTLVTAVTLEHKGLKLALHCNDCVDFHRPILVRKVRVQNLANYPRKVIVYHHNDFNMYGNKVGDTAYFDPELNSVIHYRGQRYLLTTFFADGAQRIDQYATGLSGFHGAEGTFRDAEDGHLQGNAIAQGSVDSTIGLEISLGPREEKIIYMVIAAGKSRGDLVEQHQFLQRQTPQGVIDRGTAYWRLWVGALNINFGNLPEPVVHLFKRSLLILRTQVNNNGAIIAANDSDIMQFSRDTYSYLWPRDGAMVAHALDLAGYPDVTRWFYALCKELITEQGYFHHKYNPDGSPASSWHPWVYHGKPQLPIQEDETALVIWALWRHYFRYRDIEFVRPLYLNLIQKAADFMVKYRHGPTGLPGASFDLWEERWGIHAFTVASVYGGLKAAANFAICFGDKTKAKEYLGAAEEIRAAFLKHMWSEKHGRFLRRVIPHENGHLGIDETLDSSLFAIYKFHLLPADDARVASTMRAIEEKLWIKTAVGGVARYENDYYHRVSDDIANVPGNPWFICTIWLADYYISRAKNAAELKKAMPILDWVSSHALESGVLAEQVHPYNNQPISVSPLTWSHATLVNTVIKYLEKLESLQPCNSCGQPLYHLRRDRQPVRVKSQAMLDEYDVTDLDGAETEGDFIAAGRFIKDGGRTEVTIGIDQQNCIGCGVCVLNCPENILRSVEDKALIHLQMLPQCTACGECAEVCPVQVVTVNRTAVPAEGANPGQRDQIQRVSGQFI